MKQLFTLMMTALSLAVFSKEVLIAEFDKQDAKYACGEELKLTISCQREQQAVKKFKIRYQSFVENQQEEEQEVSSADDGTIVITATNSKPSWRYFKYEATEIDGAPVKSGEVFGEAGAMFDAEKIQHLETYPDDYMAYWDRQRRRQDAVPMQATLEEIPINDARKEHLRLYTFSVTSAGISPVTGYMAIPKNAKSKSLPLFIHFQSHGEADGDRELALQDADQGALAFFVNWHGLPANKPKEYYVDTLLNDPRYGNYTFRGAESPELWWYRDMFVRDLRAIEYAQSRPEWDGKNLVFIGGSLGGAQVAFAAAHTPNVTFSICDVPAFCDISGPVCGREAGFPWKYAPLFDMGNINSGFNKTGSYFDTCNHARHINGEFYMCTGFTDTKCPPSNVYAFYNSIPDKVAKFMTTNPFTGHGGFTINVQGVERYKRFWTEFNAQKALEQQGDSADDNAVLELTPQNPITYDFPDLSFLGKWRVDFSSQGGPVQAEVRFYDANGKCCGTRKWQAAASATMEDTGLDIIVPDECLTGQLVLTSTENCKIKDIQAFQLTKGEITFTPVYDPHAPQDTSLEPMPVLDVKPPVFPAVLKPGQKVELYLELPPFSTSRRVAIATQIWRDGKLIDENWYQKDATPGTNTLELIVPLKIAPGEVTVRLQPINASFTQNITAEAMILDDGKQQGTSYPKAEIVSINGTSFVMVNGEIISATQALVDSQPRHIRNCADAGIRIWSIWLDDFGFKENGYDYSHTDAILDSILRQDPRGYVIINIIFNGRYHSWWMDKHPEAWVRTEGGSPDVGDSEGLKVMPSYSSPIWRQDFGEATRRLVEYLQTTPYAERIIGFQPCNGETSEWFNWGGGFKRFVDYSDCGQQAFRQWLTQKYKTDEGLQQAWHNSNVTLATATVPSIERRSKSKAFYDVITQHDVLDYHDFQHWHTAETILYFAKIIKDACKNQVLVGTYYGYAQHISEATFFSQSSGHFDCRQILDAPEMDFGMSPIAYCNRNVGNMAGTMIVANTWNLNKKLVWNQYDMRTFWVGGDNIELGTAKTVQEDFACQDRELARNLKEGNSTQLYDFVNGWTLGDKRLMAHAKKLNALGYKYRLITEDFPEEDYLLVVIDEKTTGIWNVFEPLYGGFLINYQRTFLDISGIPWKSVYFSDLQKHPELLKHKAMYFINLFRMDDERCRFMQEKILCDDRLVIFTGQTGIFTEQGLSSGYLEEMTGQKFKVVETPTQLVSRATGLWSELNGESWGRQKDEWTVDPASTEFFQPVNPPKDIVLATQINSDEPSALYIQKPNVKILWSQAPAFTTKVLWAIAKRHQLPVVATSNDPIYIGHGFIGIHAASDGEKQLTFIGEGTPMDILTGEKFPLQNDNQATFKMRKGETRIFVMQ